MTAAPTGLPSPLDQRGKLMLPITGGYEMITLGGREVRPGDTIMLPIYALHRHHMLWDDPDRFDPGRFAPDAPPRDRFAFLPFGAGPRICIGASFALQEAVIVLATLLDRFRFSLSGQRPDPRLILTLRPHGGVWLRVAAH